MGIIREPNGSGTLSPVAMGIAGGAARALVNPISNVKIYQQAGGPGGIGGYGSAVRNLARLHGFQGLVGMGLTPAVARAVPHYALKVGLFNRLTGQLGLSNPPGPLWPSPLSMAQCFVAGAAANAAATVFTHPLDVLKVRCVLNPPGERAFYDSMGAAWAHIVSEGPFRGLYRGLGLSLVGASVFGGASFTAWWVYERVPWRRRGRTGALVSELLEGPILALGLGAVASSAAYPFDMLRRRLMAQSMSLPRQGNLTVQFHGLPDMLYQTLRFQGVWGFFAGNVANVVKVGPQVAVMILMLSAMGSIDSPVGAAHHSL